MQVLLRVDDVEARAALRSRFEGAGGAVRELESGPEVLAALGRDPADVVVVDEALCTLSLYRAVREARPDHPLRRHLVVCVPKAARFDSLSALQAGADDFVHLPLEDNEASACVHLAASNVRLQEALHTRTDAIVSGVTRVRSEVAALERKTRSLLSSPSLAPLGDWLASAARWSPGFDAATSGSAALLVVGADVRWLTVELRHLDRWGGTIRTAALAREMRAALSDVGHVVLAPALPMGFSFKGEAIDRLQLESVEGWRLAVTERVVGDRAVPFHELQPGDLLIDGLHATGGVDVLPAGTVLSEVLLRRAEPLFRSDLQTLTRVLR